MERVPWTVSPARDPEGSCGGRFNLADGAPQMPAQLARLLIRKVLMLPSKSPILASIARDRDSHPRTSGLL